MLQAYLVLKSVLGKRISGISWDFFRIFYMEYCASLLSLLLLNTITIYNIFNDFPSHSRACLAEKEKKVPCTHSMGGGANSLIICYLHISTIFSNFASSNTRSKRVCLVTLV